MSVQLNEHYRSKSIDLIHFSNENFYNNKLKLLPDKDELNRELPGISVIRVNGIWENNINRLEAEKVAELVKIIIQNDPNKTVGIVTFNSRQQIHIIDFLEEFALDNNFILPDSLIVKNIENIQGDEKDIIIFSTVYARDISGKLKLSFGSLNAEGGENRLNVAITRAKEKIYLVTSIASQQLKTDDTKNKGPKLFKSYLEYANQVSEGTFRNEPMERGGFNKKWYLKNKIKEFEKDLPHGTKIDDSLPFADLSIIKNGKHQAVIFTDDDLYFNDISVKESHVYNPFTLKYKNWKSEAFSSRSYWLNKGKVKDQLLRLINNS
jgi:hypothetical protein